MSFMLAQFIPKSGFEKVSYLVGPIYDRVFFLYSPIAAIFVGIGLGKIYHYNLNVFGYSITALMLFFFLLETMGDIGFLRCYLNKDVFKRFWLRLTIVPMLLLSIAFGSDVGFLALLVLETFVDAYHSSNQTFGIARFYDTKHKNDPKLFRNYDYALNYAIYIGPMLIVSQGLIYYIESFSSFDIVAEGNPILLFLGNIPELLSGQIEYIASVSLFIIVLIIFAYILKFGNLMYNKKYSFPRPKFILYICTAICCFYVWSFESLLVAYAAVNAFHSFQYFGLTWMSEKNNIKNILRLKKDNHFNWLLAFLLFCFLGTLFALFESFANARADEWYAIGYETRDTPIQAIMNFPGLWLIKAQVVCILMHYYSDSFIWSLGRTNFKQKIEM